MIRIIAIGAPHGDDAVGLVLGRRLAAAPPPACDVRIRERPGLSLLDDLFGATAVLLIDAVQSGGHSGDIIEVDLCADDVVSGAGARTSSHGIGVADALRLAFTLGNVPQTVHLLGIEVATPRGFADLSAEVAAAVCEVESRARAWATDAGKRTSISPGRP